MVLRFEAANVAKHGIGFLPAAGAFADPKLVLAEDADHSGQERRYFAFGMLGRAVLTVRFTLRGDAIRLFGAGYWRRGKNYHEEANRLYG